jgi:hypothetical protein
VTSAKPSSGADGSEVRHQLGPYEVAAATGFGPRLVGLIYGGGPEILARLDPIVGIDIPDLGRFRFHGGHRLWVSPESPPVTYAPDDHHCAVTTGSEGLTITAPVDAAGFVKELRVTWDGVNLIVEHRVEWAGRQPIKAGPWGITQLPLGGVAIMPIRPADGQSSFQADCSLVLWPYTDLDDRRISWQARAVVVNAHTGPRLKLGTGPGPPRLGYLREGQLFIKHAEPGVVGEYPDRGAVGQLFVNEAFCELETVGPIVSMEPGSETWHREAWEARECPDLDTALGIILERGAA